MHASIREVQCEIRMDLADAPQVKCLGRKRKPRGLRIAYGRSRGVDRVDLVVEFRSDAQLWPSAEPLPVWLREIIEQHRPADVSDPDAMRRPGMGGLRLTA